MRKIAKYVAVGALVTPLVIGSAGLASAHDGPDHDGHGYTGPAYGKAQNWANANGGRTTVTYSGFTPDGKAYFVTATKKAGPTGAYGSATGSHS
ncbi:hypothetical protein OKJ48_11115 [Streptomyces kunmingensis]|uniref:Uncharacterized protein n=1 Tax=Streptomyces kunmingensis TaxID=68225 RepID=A0ABU6C7U3_9ACTN|nr:hypothetical protein [Streptomyces kunmingensis]MEB3960788.1 hypothetical protein [Streptomyces kunmingensis]